MLPFILLIAQSQNWTLGSHKVMLMHSLANLVQSTTLLLRVVVKKHYNYIFDAKLLCLGVCIATILDGVFSIVKQVIKRRQCTVTNC